ncbi:acyl-CoA dehydrogenase family protein [Nonomuraea zeae]|uniref:SfnB family sulfur acquisition oxidoreductase n=1 Tax=Nonomuraea zeae TaxID=1642303 RepID=A0A5S4GU14_9ACTN|nr:acyl-CoA dehydrogenase family protein [Nonomuraea zeae]TMR35964.1 SfnB family sulfur acquisition oxidoreductase [Nonomuraea zeae]
MGNPNTHPTPVITTAEEALEAARRIAPELAAGAADRDTAAEPPAEALALVAGAGLLGVSIPRDLGGAGLPAADLIEIVRILAVADSSVAQTLLPHFVLLGAVTGLATPGLRERVLPDVLAGGLVGNATSERGTKHAWDPQTTVVADGDEVVVNGRKYYATGALSAAWVSVLAKDEQGRLVTVFVPRDAKGLELSADWTSFGQRATVSGGAVLNDVRVGADHVVPLYLAFTGPTVGGAFDQLIHIAIDVGIARAALEAGAGFVRTHSRPWFESDVERVTDEQSVLVRFGQIAGRVIVAELALGRAAQLLDEVVAVGPDDDNTALLSAHVAAVKSQAAQVAVQTASDVFELAGTRATDAAFGLDRHWRNARTHTLHDPVRWKEYHLGNFLLNDVRPPRNPLN